MASLKTELRQRFRVARRSHASRVDPQSLAERIDDRLRQLAAWQSAQRVCIYVSTPIEVPTHNLISVSLREGEREVVVPYCVGRRLELFRLVAWDELAPGKFGILEPRAELRHDSRRHVDPRDIDLFLVPGVAFTLDGRRLGNGWGFYDRLLAAATPVAVRIGLALTAQITSDIPAQPHDIPMHWLITEHGCWACGV